KAPKIIFLQNAEQAPNHFQTRGLGWMAGRPGKEILFEEIVNFQVLEQAAFQHSNDQSIIRGFSAFGKTYPGQKFGQGSQVSMFYEEFIARHFAAIDDPEIFVPGVEDHFEGTPFFHLPPKTEGSLGRSEGMAADTEVL